MRREMASRSVGLVKTLMSGACGEVGQIDLHAVAEAAGELVVYGDGGHLGQEGARVGEESFEFGDGVLS